LLTNFRPWFRRAASQLKRPAKAIRPGVVSFRPRVEGLEDRTLLASSLLLSGFPSATTAGVAGNLTVTTLQSDGTTDTAYTGTIFFTSTDAQAGLPAAYTFTAADQGVRTFNVTLRLPGLRGSGSCGLRLWPVRTTREGKRRGPLATTKRPEKPCVDTS
jgi:hypothetical protein